MSKVPENLEEILRLLESLGINFRDPDYISVAFTHSSFSYEKELSYDNERLEFLGDSVINMLISEELYNRFPQDSEAELSKMKSYLVSNEVMAEVCGAMELNEYLLLGKGENQQNGSTNKRNVACLFEALMGALYLDQGLEGVRSVVVKYLLLPYLKGSQSEYYGDCKSPLQEVCVKRFQKLPRYELVEKKGEEHSPYFRVKVVLGKETYGYGCGPSLKKAQNEAAYFALQKISAEKGGLSTIHER